MYKTIEHANMDFLMDEYFMKHLVYPNTAEEYLYQTYRADSMNNFGCLRFEVQNVHLNIDTIANKALAQKFVQVYSEMDSVKIDVDYHQYNALRLMAHGTFKEVDMLGGWGLIANKRKQIKIKETENYLFMLIPSEKIKYKCTKVNYELDKYISKYDDWEKNNWRKLDRSFDMTIARTNVLKETRVFTRMADNSLICRDNIMLPDSLPGLLVNMLDNAIPSKGDNPASFRSVPHFLMYDKHSGFDDYVQHLDVQHTISENTLMVEYLNSILDATHSDVILFSLPPK